MVNGRRSGGNMTPGQGEEQGHRGGWGFGRWGRLSQKPWYHTVDKRGGGGVEWVINYWVYNNKGRNLRL